MNTKLKWIPLFATNFLGVFNNNLFQTLIFLLAINWVSKEYSQLIVPIASGLYVISYIFFSPFAGYLAKTKQKKTIILVSRIFEFGLFLVGSIGFLFENVYIVMITIFCLGLVSTLFSPAKYGLIRDIGGAKGISFGTGTLEMLTFFGALLGPLVATIISDHYIFIYLFPLFLGISFLSFLSIFYLKVDESEPIKNCNDTKNPISFVIQLYKFANTVKGLNVIILGLASFWMIASFIKMTVVEHCPSVLKMTNTQMGYVLSASALGIGLGSYITGLISKGTIKLWLTPIGSLGMLISLIALYFFKPEGIMFTLFIFSTAFSCGMFMVPLSSFVQSSVEGRKQGDVIAYSNFLIFLLIFLSAGIYGLITKFFDTNSVFLFLIFIVAAISIILIIKAPGMLYRRNK